MNVEGRIVGGLHYDADFRAYLLFLDDVEGEYAFEQALSTMREMNDTLTKSNTQAINVVSKRVADSFDEVKTAFAKTAKK